MKHSFTVSELLGGGGGGSTTKNREKNNNTKFSKLLTSGICVLSTLFRENVANFTNNLLCFMIIKHLFHCASNNITLL